MQKMRMMPCAVALLLASGSHLALKAADEAPPAKAPDRPELREQLKNLTPEERAAKIKEFREQRRDELQKLSPEERAAKIKEEREKRAAVRQALTPQEREAKRKEIRDRMDKQLGELRKKKADGTLTPQEEKHLGRLEEVSKRFDQGGGPGAATRRLPPAVTPGDQPGKSDGGK